MKNEIAVAVRMRRVHTPHSGDTYYVYIASDLSYLYTLLLAFQSHRILITSTQAYIVYIFFSDQKIISHIFKFYFIIMIWRVCV